jgi:hypothetical protein
MVHTAITAADPHAEIDAAITMLGDSCSSTRGSSPGLGGRKKGGFIALYLDCRQ